MTLAATLTNENVLNTFDGIILVNEINGAKQMISVDTINGKKVRNIVNAERSEKVSEIFPQGLPAGMDFMFVSLANNN